MPDEQSPATSRARTVLLVEDEESVRRLFSVVLESAGYQVLQAAEPRQAIESARGLQGSLDLLITDLNMPDMDGRAVAAEIVAMQPACKVLFISGYAADSPELGGDTNFGAFLQKPFTPRTLIARVCELLQQ
jgi:CheY-like chemotaxis protein